MSTVDTVIGLDIGTTTSKALIRPVASPDTRVVEIDTPWSDAGGACQIRPETLVTTAVELIARSVDVATTVWGPCAVRAVSVTGLAESGVVIDPDGRTDVPAIAWFDRRGEAELATLAARHPSFAARFTGVTGLPWSPQPTFAKLLWLHGRRPVRAGSCWLNVPEWIVHALGGDRASEPSLAARTGLVDQDTGRTWADALELAGVTPNLMPDTAPAGTPLGKLTHPDLPAAAAGAVLSVAGHDHPVAALAVDAVEAQALFNSSGTADVLALAVPSGLGTTARAAIVAAGWSAGAHVVPGLDLLLAGGNGGLLMRRVLEALGAVGADDRARLDAAAAAVTSIPAGLVVRGDGRTDDDVVIRLRDHTGPASIWAAAAAYTAGLTADMLAAIEPIVGPHRRAVAAGGWTRMESVCIARRRVITDLVISDLPQPGAAGAALIAEYSLTTDGRQLSDHVHDLRRAATPEPKGSS